MQREAEQTDWLSLLRLVICFKEQEQDTCRQLQTAVFGTRTDAASWEHGTDARFVADSATRHN